MPFVLNNPTFKNQVPIGFLDLENGKMVSPVVDFDNLRKRAIFVARHFNCLEDHNKERKGLNLIPHTQTEFEDYIGSNFGKEGKAVPITWSMGYIIYFLRKEGNLYLAYELDMTPKKKKKRK